MRDPCLSVKCLKLWPKTLSMLGLSFGREISYSNCMEKRFGICIKGKKVSWLLIYPVLTVTLSFLQFTAYIVSENFYTRSWGKSLEIINEKFWIPENLSKNTLSWDTQIDLIALISKLIIDIIAPYICTGNCCLLIISIIPPVRLILIFL